MSEHNDKEIDKKILDEIGKEWQDVCNQMKDFPKDRTDIVDKDLNDPTDMHSMIKLAYKSGYSNALAVIAKKYGPDGY